MNIQSQIQLLSLKIHVRSVIRSLLILVSVSGVASAQNTDRTPQRTDRSPQQVIEQQVPAARKILDSYHAQDPVPSKRTLHIVYWTPSDREPIEGYRERLSRVMFSIRDFYKTEMVRLGFGERTIQLATEPDGLLKVHLVRGQEPYANYEVESGQKIRVECLPTLTTAGIAPERETILLFCNMSNWDPAKMTISQNSPYYASGSLRNGIAWQVDSALLDSKLLSAREPIITDLQYGSISLGKYNSIFVGGVCHELGHALGLPHNMERPDERRAFGTALMGSGNRSFGDSLRGEGRGTFLTLAEGLRLASHPLFTGSEKGVNLPENAQLSDIDVQPAKDGKSLRFSATVTADPPAYAVIGYLDPTGGSDYDAATVTAVPDASGRFELHCSTFKKSKNMELRIVVCQANGGRLSDQVLKVPFSVDAQGVVDMSSYSRIIKLSKLAEAVKHSDAQMAAAELAKLEQSAEQGEKDKQLLEVARSLAVNVRYKPGPAPSDCEKDECWLSDATYKSANVGWLRPTFNRLPSESVVINVGGKLFARGIYAHSPSEYVYELGGKWSRLTGFAGIADGNGGSVVFVIQGDGKELWRSPRTSESPALEVSLDVTEVNELTLRVENAGDGNGGDWGTWCDLKLTR